MSSELFFVVEAEKAQEEAASGLEMNNTWKVQYVES